MFKKLVCSCGKEMEKRYDLRRTSTYKVSCNYCGSEYYSQFGEPEQKFYDRIRKHISGFEKDLLFQKIKCRAYLNRIYDGRYIRVFEKNETESGQIEACYMEGLEESKIKCEMDDSYDFLKTYYERRRKEFSGFVVGFKDVETQGYLTAVYEEPEYGGERVYFGKKPVETRKCAIVYYANNRKRLVPVEDLVKEEAWKKRELKRSVNGQIS